MNILQAFKMAWRSIIGKKGRSVEAVRALLDLDALKGSADRSTDIAKALDDAAKARCLAAIDRAVGPQKTLVMACHDPAEAAALAARTVPVA